MPLHLVMDNYGTHKEHPRVRAWLRQHPRFVLHFVPTSCSWLSLIERWFRGADSQAGAPRIVLQRGRIAPGNSGGSGDLEPSPQPFVWTATVDSSTAKLSTATRPSS